VEGPLEILAIEPWLGGSHARFLEGWRARSRHRVRILGLPARHWRWRMHGAAHTLARRAAEEPSTPDALLVSDYLDLARFRGLAPASWRSIPALAYFHENQLTYPARLGEKRDERDFALGFSNLLTLLAADAVAFNSRFHLEELGAAALELLTQLPKPRPRRELEQALERARVIWPGIELEALPLGPGPPGDSPLRVAFNHRWEYDKDPAAFLRAALAARRAGAELELVLLGESFSDRPAEVDELLVALGDLLLHRGYAPDRSDYARQLGECDVVVSTARHEFYGMALLEGVALGCAPLAPNRLAYPEVLEARPGESVLYQNEDELCARLSEAAHGRRGLRVPESRQAWRDRVASHGAARTSEALDSQFEELAWGAPRTPPPEMWRQE